MLIKEENCVELINNYNRKHWQPLFDFIPKFEKEGLTSFEISSLGFDFSGVVDELGILIIFDWTEWKGKYAMVEPNFDFDSTDLVSKCKLISAIMRQDRFSDGALDGNIESGLILKLLKSIEKQVG